MSDHKVRMRMTFPKRNASTLWRPVCVCGERGPLTPNKPTADDWAERHMAEDRP